MKEEMSNEAEPVDSDENAGESIVDTLSVNESTEFVVEEKKSLNLTTVALFLVLAVGGAGLYFMHLRTGPKAAAAAAASAQTAQAGKTIDQFLSGGNQNMKLMEQMLQNTQKVVQQFLNYPSVTQVPLEQLQTNPFRMTSSRRESSEGNSATSDRRKREAERLAVLKSVQELQLQSVVHSDARKACMINNTLYKEGQQVNGFTVEKISSNSVVVKSGAYRFELKMQK